MYCRTHWTIGQFQVRGTFSLDNTVDRIWTADWTAPTPASSRLQPPSVAIQEISKKFVGVVNSPPSKGSDRRMVISRESARWPSRQKEDQHADRTR